MSRILVVDDEPHIADGLRFNLQAEGHDVTVTYDGEQALALLLEGDEPFDVVILDVMLPGKDGFETAAELRAAGQYVPILMLTARGRADDVLRGFEAGADDYLPKPFELTILLARVNGLLRRRRWNERDTPAAEDAAADSYAFAGRVLDFGAMEVRAQGRSFRLTQMESDLLRYLVQHPGQAVSRGAILENVWDLHGSTDTRAIDNFIVRLRRYIEDKPSSPRFLLTVRGVGYRFVPEGTESST
ncbi:MAG TPA: response regulator transcription factor [Vicinamibacterales bacterium]|jgi:DNA-binding response OmpR family regulator|nr:response regulator transcription factor [Vicinamibacterales bacterium]